MCVMDLPALQMQHALCTVNCEICEVIRYVGALV